MKVTSILLFLTIICSAGTASAQALFDDARKLFNEGHYADAEKIFQAEAEKTTQRADVYYWLGRCAYEQYDNDQAVNDGERAVELDPKTAEYVNFLGRAHGRKAEHSSWFSALSLARKASREFEQAAQMEPGNVRFARDLISYDMRAPGVAGGGDDKAEALIAQLAAADPVQGQLAKLEFYEVKKKWDLAEDECKAVLTAKPKDVGPYLDIARHYEARDDATGIRNAMAAIPQNAPSDLRVFYYRGVADILAEDRLQEAETSLTTYLANLPQRREDHASRSTSLRRLGQLYEKLGRRESAAAQYRMAVQLNPDDKAAHEGLKRTGF